MSDLTNNFVKCKGCGMTFWVDVTKGPMFGWDQIKRSHLTFASDHHFKPEWIIRGSVRDFRPSDPDSVASSDSQSPTDGGRLEK